MITTATLIKALEAIETRLSDSIALSQSVIAVLEITRCELMKQLAAHDAKALLDFIAAESPEELYSYINGLGFI